MGQWDGGQLEEGVGSGGQREEVRERRVKAAGWGTGKRVGKRSSRAK